MAIINPRRGEVWRAMLEPVRGSEQGKRRPVVVLSEAPVGRATVHLCAPIMNALPIHSNLFWCVEIAPNPQNGLSKDSTADAAQTRALDTQRFEARLGQVSREELDAITAALCLCVGRQPMP